MASDILTYLSYGQFRSGPTCGLYDTKSSCPYDQSSFNKTVDDLYCIP